MELRLAAATTNAALTGSSRLLGILVCSGCPKVFCRAGCGWLSLPTCPSPCSAGICSVLSCCHIQALQSCKNRGICGWMHLQCGANMKWAELERTWDGQRSAPAACDYFYCSAAAASAARIAATADSRT